jgi:hypothetical protein
MAEPSAPGGRPRLSSELAVLDHLGIPDFRHLSKDTFFRFLETLPDTDPAVALELLGQVPELAAFARGALADATENFNAVLESQSTSQQMAHAVHMKRLEILEAELDKELTPEQWIRVLDDIREVNSNELNVFRENSAWLSDSLRAKLAATGGAALGLAALVFAASQARSKDGPGAGRIFRS